VALTKILRETLCQLEAAGSTWTITMIDSYYQAACKLEKRGLVEFRARHVGRGKLRGQLNGHDVIVTRAGKAVLARRTGC